MWTSWMLLAACAVIAQSFPQPSEYVIPTVPTGKRDQYYVLHDDGGFKYGYDTGDGAYESVVKMGSGDLTGFFGYNNPLGEAIRVDYTAGSQGYKPTGNHLNVASEIPGYVPLTSVHQNTAQVGFKSALVSTGKFENANVKSTSGAGGAYSFSYNNEDSSRSEAADASNTVVGQYSFVADDGQNREIRYRAGSRIGFVPEGDSIPKADGVQEILTSSASVYNAPVQAIQISSSHSGTEIEQSSQPRKDASYSFNYQNADSAREETADRDLNVMGRFSFVDGDGQQRTVKYIAGSKTGFVAEGEYLSVPQITAETDATQLKAISTPVQYSSSSQFLPSVPSASVSASDTRGDASYQFSYQTGDSSRAESSDSDLNVKGDYSFLADDGQLRTVNYVAGSSTGFVAHGSHLPVASDTPVASATPTVARVPTVYAAPSATIQGTAGFDYSSGGGSDDASYSFGYNTGSSFRSETSDKDLNVEGKYGFVSDDGIERTVNYRAGAGTGFVAEGSHIPVVSDHSTSLTKGSSSAFVPQVLVKSASTAPLLSHEAASALSKIETDGSYRFSFANADSSRSESGDALNNVVGQYSFVADDGRTRQISYRAGSGVGFVPEGEDIPVVHQVPSVPNVAANARAPSPTRYTYSATAETASGQSVQSDADGSYSFSYQNQDSAREENADSNLNVKGRYSFVADDGVQRSVYYIAGSETGFVADGAHLPVPPESLVASSSKVAAVPSPVQYSAPARSPPAGLRSSVLFSEPKRDASYSFKYQNENSAREESADNDLNVKGSFSFKGNDGIQRTVNYVAGSETGFLAHGAHFPEPPKYSGSVSVQTAPINQTPYSGFPSLVVSVLNEDTEERGDASYSFKYDADDSSRDETADADLNIKGRYTFVADDGVERIVNYIAGSGTGFVADGLHIPVVDAASSSVRSLGSSASSGSGSSFSTSGSAASSSVGLIFDGGNGGSTVYSAPVLSHHSLSSSDIVGNVLLTQYTAVPGRQKYGYVFTEN